jgi:NMDA receptor-regulated protein 1
MQHSFVRCTCSTLHTPKGEDLVQDPLGKKLIATEQPLVEAEKLVQMLKTHAPQDIRSHVAAFDVAERLDKPHLALKAAKQAVAIDAASPEPHMLRIRALLWLEKRLPQIEIKVARDGMEAELQKLTGVRLFVVALGDTKYSIAND